jgi:two-component system cell cycle response regulator CtrA
MRILVIESDVACAESLELSLKIDGFRVYTAGDAKEGLSLAKLYDYDCIVSGYHGVLREIRRAAIKTPVLILSGLTGIEDKVKALNIGADDYMTKPFHKDELVARIHALVRRSKGHAQSVITTGDLVLNLDTKLVTVAGQPVGLTGKEYQTLELLSLRKGSTLTKEMFLDHLYGGMDEPEMRIIDVYICKLRKKLEYTSKGNRYIETIWGRGYILRDPATPTVDKGPIVRNPVGYAGKGLGNPSNRHGRAL